MKNGIIKDDVIDLVTALDRWAVGLPQRAVIGDAIASIAAAAIDLEQRIAESEPGDGDRTTALDVVADEMLVGALSNAPIAGIGSAARDEVVTLDASAGLAVTLAPLDGSSNIDANIPIGTIFSILPISRGDDLAEALLQPGNMQLAAGFILYGPKTSLALTLGEGVEIHTLDRTNRVFRRSHSDMQIAVASGEYAIDASAYRHWDAPMRAYVDDNIARVDGPRGSCFNMRWIGSLVAEAYRILIRGGLFLCPGDHREGYEDRLPRLVSAANPLAMVIEQAGGLATDGEERILDLKPKTLHRRVPLVFGSKPMVERVRSFHDGTLPLGERSPLFGHRGLFRH